MNEAGGMADALRLYYSDRPVDEIPFGSIVQEIILHDANRVLHWLLTQYPMLVDRYTNVAAKWNVLHLACFREAWQCMFCLLDNYGMDINNKDQAGYTPFHHVVSSASLTMIKQVFQVYHPRLDDVRIFELVMMWGNPSILNFLLESGMPGKWIRPRPHHVPGYLTYMEDYVALIYMRACMVVEYGGSIPSDLLKTMV